MKLALVSNYEILKRRQVDRYNRLARLLEQRGMELLLLTTTLHDDLEVPFVQIPYGLMEFADLKVPAQHGPALAPLLRAEEAWAPHFDVDRADRGARHCRGFYDQLLSILLPDVVCVFNTLHPHSRIFQLLCEEREFPVFTLERGFVPETLQLDRQRNNCASELNDSFLVHHLAQTTSTRADDGGSLGTNSHEAPGAHGDVVPHPHFEAYKKYFLAKRPNKYPTKHDDGAPPAQKPYVLVLAPHRGAAISDRRSNLVRRSLPHFADFRQVAESVRTHCPDRVVVFRDHPIDVHCERTTELPEGILRDNRTSITALLENSELVVCIGPTTTLFEALLFEKPTICVGSTALDRFAPYYRCSDGDLEATLTQARTQGWEGIKHRAERALDFVLAHFLIGDGDEIPCGRNLRDVADFLSSYDLGETTPLNDRFARLGEWGASI